MIAVAGGILLAAGIIVFWPIVWRLAAFALITAFGVALLAVLSWVV